MFSWCEVGAKPQKCSFLTIQSDKHRIAQNKTATGRNFQLPQMMHWKAQKDPQTLQRSNIHQYQYILGHFRGLLGIQESSKDLILPPKKPFHGIFENR